MLLPLAGAVAWSCSLSLAQEQPRADWTAEGDQADCHFSYCVAKAGDVNGDGYGDVIIGADLFDNGQSNEGRAFVYHGTPSGLGPSPSWAAEPDQVNAIFGRAVAGAGDVNGDGYDDVIVGAYQYDNGQSNEGRAFVYHGSPSGLSPTPNWTAESNQANAYLGIWVSTAGDVNGDGFADVIVGAYQYDNGHTDEGRALVYHGSATGLSPEPNWTAEPDQGAAGFGYSVASAGDVNSDGFGDVIVGAYGYPGGGRAFVYLGSPAGLGAAAAWSAGSGQAGSFFGFSVAGAGDVNDDDFADVIVGAYQFDDGQPDEGMAFVYYGSPSGPSLVPDWTVQGDQPSTLLGGSVAGAGDVNGDGVGDVIVGGYAYSDGQFAEGLAMIFHGSSAGLGANADWSAQVNQASAFFGDCVAAAGDVNGDGVGDVIISANSFDNGQSNEGRAFVYHGGTPARPCPADVAPAGKSVGDGVVNVDDLLAVINSWGGSEGPADINLDGLINVDDLLIVISSWGPCG